MMKAVVLPSVLLPAKEQPPKENASRSVKNGSLTQAAAHPSALTDASLLPREENVSQNARSGKATPTAAMRSPSRLRHLQRVHLSARWLPAGENVLGTVKATVETLSAVDSVQIGVSELPRKENVCRNVKNTKATRTAAIAVRTSAGTQLLVDSAFPNASCGRMMPRAAQNAQQSVQKLLPTVNVYLSVKSTTVLNAAQNAQPSVWRTPSTDSAPRSVRNTKGTPTVAPPSARPNVPADVEVPVLPLAHQSATTFQVVVLISTIFCLELLALRGKAKEGMTADQYSTMLQIVRKLDSVDSGVYFTVYVLPFERLHVPYTSNHVI